MADTDTPGNCLELLAWGACRLPVSTATATATPPARCAMSDDFGPPSPARSPRSECDDWWLLRCRCRGLARTCVVRRILWYHTDGARALVCGAHRGLDSTRWGADSTYFAGAGYGTVDAREEGATAPLIARALPLS